MAVLRDQDSYVLGDFAPDVDSKLPGIVTDANWVWSPNVNGGWRSMGHITPEPAASPVTIPTTCLGAFYAQLSAVTPANIWVFGTGQQLFIWNGPGSSLVNQNLVLHAAARWDFALYGTDVIAVNGVDPPQASLAGANQFSALPGNPPISSDVAATDFALFLLPTNSNELYYSLNDELWTPSIQTQTGTVTLTATPGPITAIGALRTGLMAYKATSCYFAQFLGGPPFFQFNKLSDAIGILSPMAWISTGTYHYFIGQDNFYVSDSFSVQPLPNNLRKWFFNTIDSSNPTAVGVYDWQHSQLIWWFATSSAPAGIFDRYVSLSLLTNRWSTGYVNIQSPIIGLMSQQQLQFVDSGSRLVQVDLDNDYTANNPNNPLSYVQSGDLGDNVGMYRLSRVRPHFLTLPDPTSFTPQATAPECYVTGTYIQGQGYQAQANPKLSSVGFFDMVTTNRLLRLKFSFYHGCELAGFNAKMRFAGTQ